MALRRLDAFEAAGAGQSAYDGPVLLLHECLAVLFVRALCLFDCLNHQPAVTSNEWHTLRPAGRHVHHRQPLDERARNGGAAVRYHVDLAKAGQSLNAQIGTSRRFAE